MIEEKNPTGFVRVDLLHERGWIDARFLLSYKELGCSGFLEDLSLIYSAKRSSSVKSRIAVVSQKLEKLLDEDDLSLIKNLFSNRKTDRTKALMKILFPSIKIRHQIQSIRKLIIDNLRKNIPIASADCALISELFSLLTFGSSEFNEIFADSLNNESKIKAKKLLTSLRKMIGGNEGMEDEDKKEKKNAYSRNLDIRKILAAIQDNITDEEIKKKLNNILSTPKNKKWFGLRFHKLLLANNWEEPQVRKFLQQLKQASQLSQINNIKIRKVKSILKSIIFNIENMLLEWSRNPQEIEEDFVIIAEENQLKDLIDPFQLSSSLKCHKTDPTNFSLFDSLLLDFSTSRQ